MIYSIKSVIVKWKKVNQARKAFHNYRAFYDVDRNNRFTVLLSYSDILKQEWENYGFVNLLYKTKTADFNGSKINVCLTGFCKMPKMQHAKHLEFAKYLANSISWIHLDCGFAEKIWTLWNISQASDFRNLEFVDFTTCFTDSKF